MVRAQDVSLQRVILFTRKARIGISGCVARRSDLAAFVEIFQHWHAPAGLMPTPFAPLFSIFAASGHRFDQSVRIASALQSKPRKTPDQDGVQNFLHSEFVKAS